MCEYVTGFLKQFNFEGLLKKSKTDLGNILFAMTTHALRKRPCKLKEIFRHQIVSK